MIERNAFENNFCKITTDATPITSGIPYGYFKILVSFRLYIINIGIIAVGNILVKCLTISGICLSSLNTTNGKNLTTIIPSDTVIIAKIMYGIIYLYDKYIEISVYLSYISSL